MQKDKRAWHVNDRNLLKYSMSQYGLKLLFGYRARIKGRKNEKRGPGNFLDEAGQFYKARVCC